MNFSSYLSPDSLEYNFSANVSISKPLNVVKSDIESNGDLKNSYIKSTIFYYLLRPGITSWWYYISAASIKIF